MSRVTLNIHLSSLMFGNIDRGSYYRTLFRHWLSSIPSILVFFNFLCYASIFLSISLPSCLYICLSVYLSPPLFLSKGGRRSKGLDCISFPVNILTGSRSLLYASIKGVIIKLPSLPPQKMETLLTPHPHLFLPAFLLPTFRRSFFPSPSP